MEELAQVVGEEEQLKVVKLAQQLLQLFLLSVVAPQHLRF